MGCEAGRCKTSTPKGIFIMTPSLEGWPTKPKEAPSPHEVRLASLVTNLKYFVYRKFLILIWTNKNQWLGLCSHTDLESEKSAILSSIFNMACLMMHLHRFASHRFYMFSKILIVRKIYFFLSTRILGYHIQIYPLFWLL